MDLARLKFDGSMPSLLTKAEVEEDLRTIVTAVTGVIGHRFTEKDQRGAERRFRSIEPILDRRKFQLLWLACGNKKGRVVRHIASVNGVTGSTIYGWIKAFAAGGLPGLTNKGRRNRGIPKALNRSSLEFLIMSGLLRYRKRPKLSIQELYRAYEEERAWRDTYVGKPISETRLNYARYLDSQGCLRSDAVLLEISYATFRRWFNKIPGVLLSLARMRS